MCNVYSITAPVAEKRCLFDVCVNNDQLGNFKPLAAVFPKRKAPVVRIGDGVKGNWFQWNGVSQRQNYKRKQVN